MNKAEIIECIRPVVDPEIGVSIVDMGLIYDVDLDEKAKKVVITMTLTSPGCPVGPELMGGVHTIVKDHTGYEDIHVELVWEPMWDPKEMASDEVKDLLGIW